MFPDGSHELEDNFQTTLGPAAMKVAFAYIFQEVGYGEGVLQLLELALAVRIDLALLAETCGAGSSSFARRFPFRREECGIFPTTRIGHQSELA